MYETETSVWMTTNKNLITSQKYQKNNIGDGQDMQLEDQTTDGTKRWLTGPQDVVGEEEEDQAGDKRWDRKACRKDFADWRNRKGGGGGGKILFSIELVIDDGQNRDDSNKKVFCNATMGGGVEACTYEAQQNSNSESIGRKWQELMLWWTVRDQKQSLKRRIAFKTTLV